MVWGGVGGCGVGGWVGVGWVAALAKLETEQRAAAELIRSAGQALQAVIDRRVDAEAFSATDHEVLLEAPLRQCAYTCE